MPRSMPSPLVASVLLIAWIVSVDGFAQNWRPLQDNGAFEETEASIERVENSSLRAQLMATYLTYVGRQDLQAGIESRLPGPEEVCIADQEDYQWRSAAEWVLDAASNHRVVMFNENHFRVESRAFVFELLPKLYEMGFTQIGFEAFENPEGLARRAAAEGRENWGYMPEWGSYTHEPVFAALVRRAHDLGFEVFGYETSERPPQGASRRERIMMREEGQADHVIAALQDAGDEAKAVLFGGWSHIAEEPLSSGQSWMAAQFKERTGIDPLTVDTTTCTYEAQADGVVVDLKLPLNKDGRPLVVERFVDAVDAQLHLPVPVDSEAPGFRRQVLGTPVEIPKEFLPDDQRVLVRARRTDRPADAVPDDQVLVRPSESLKLYLTAGHEYEVTGHRGDGSLTGRQVIAVE